MPMPCPFQRRCRQALGVLTLGFVGLSQAQSLPALLQAARGHDAAFQAAQAQHAAAQHRAEQAKGLRRAQVSADASYGRSTTDTPYTNSVLSTQGNALTTNLSFNQPLWNAATNATVAQAELSLGLALADVQAAEQDLVLRVAQAYFDVLVAQDSLATVRASVAAVTEQRAAALRSFEVGTATITDSREAQARFDLAAAQELAAANDLRAKQLTLEQLVGQSGVQPQGLRLPMVLPPLLPHTAEAWVQRALEHNPSLRKARTAVEVAELDTRKARAGHLPSVALSGRYSRADQSGSAEVVVNPASRTVVNSSQSGISTSTTLGLTVTVPLYSGLSVDQRVKETLKLEDKARHDRDAAQRGAELGTRQAFMATEALGAQVKALEAAEASSRLALESTRLGYQVGVRVNLDVLNAQAQLFQTQRDLAKARYDLLLAGLRLRQVAGQLGEADVTALSPLFNHSPAAR